jgi:hypothetical protein
LCADAEGLFVTINLDKMRAMLEAGGGSADG